MTVTPLRLEWGGPGDAPTPPDLADPGKRIDMTERTCSVEGCDRPHRAQGLCSGHHKRLTKGQPIDSPLLRVGSPTERFWNQVEKAGPDDCWLWTGALTWGYGSISVDSKRRRAHRFAYELFVGPIPDGLDIDHTCHNGSGCAGGPSCLHRRCVNPAHLEPVTRRENTLRGEAPSALCNRQTHCLNGHEFTPENTYVNGGKRFCRACGRERKRAEKKDRKDVVDRWRTG